MPGNDIDLKSDKQGRPVQGVVHWANSQVVSITTTTARNTTDLVAPLLRISCNVDCYFKLGNATVNAVEGDHFLPAGGDAVVPRGSNVRVAAITIAGAGVMGISELG